MGKRQYSDNDRATALAAYDANGSNVRLTARQLKIPHKTLDEWVKGRVNADCADIRTVKKGELADKLEELAHQIIDAAPEKIDKAGLKDALIAFGTAVDKMRLLRDEATSITKDVTPMEKRAKVREWLKEQGVLTSDIVQ